MPTRLSLLEQMRAARDQREGPELRDVRAQLNAGHFRERMLAARQREAEALRLRAERTFACELIDLIQDHMARDLSRAITKAVLEARNAAKGGHELVVTVPVDLRFDTRDTIERTMRDAMLSQQPMGVKYRPGPKLLDEVVDLIEVTIPEIQVTHLVHREEVEVAKPRKPREKRKKA